MNKIIFLAIFILISYGLFAQKSDETKDTLYRHDLSIDVSGLFYNIVGINSTNISQPNNVIQEYLILYRFGINEKFNYRLGSNFDMNKTENTAYNYDTILHYTSSFFNIGSGLEFHKTIHKRFSYFTGVDYVFQYAFNESQNINYNTQYLVSGNSLKYYHAVKMFFGVRFDFTKRMSVSTYAGIIGGLTKTKNKYTYEPLPGSAFPEYNDESEIMKNSYFEWFYPLSISLHIKL